MRNTFYLTEDGAPRSQNAVALLVLQSGRRASLEDTANAEKHLRTCAAAGDPVGQYNLSCFLERRSGLSLFGERKDRENSGQLGDLTEAFTFLRLAAEGDIKEAQFHLGRLLIKGSSELKIEADNKAGTEWLLKAASSGYKPALVTLCASGDIVDQWPEITARAVKLIEQAAQDGESMAQATLGYKYRTGKGVEQNFEKAVFWYGKAAAQGHAIAAFNLGLRYERGEGVQVDLRKAKELYTLAAGKGIIDAQRKVQELSTLSDL